MHVKSLNFGYRADLMTNSVGLTAHLSPFTRILAFTLTLSLIINPSSHP